LGPGGALAFLSRGDTLRYKGEFARAIEDYERALQIEPKYIPALAGLGLTYEKMGDLTSARREFKQATISENKFRFVNPSPSALETAQARLAALDSGAAPPAIPVSLPKGMNFLRTTISMMRGAKRRTSSIDSSTTPFGGG